MPVKHFMMFSTFAEQRHFIYPSEQTYDGVIFNANMVAHAPGGLTGFLVTRTSQLSYFIDPLTHAFQHAPSVILKDGTSEIKKAFDTLASAYGSPIREKAGKHSVVPEDFNDPVILRKFVQNVLEFQRTQISKRAAEHNDTKYYDENELAIFNPSALVAPYFFIREFERERWLATNVELVESAVEQRIGDEVILAEVVLDRASLFDKEWIKQVANAYNSANPGGYLIWIDEFDEHQASVQELTGFLELCRLLRTNNKPVTNLHGGYFSILAAGTLGDGALTGVTHGPEFGESRAVVPVGGGLPFAKFYLPQLHERVKYRNMLAILDFKEWNIDAETFHSKVCDCPACKEVLSGDIENFARYGESAPMERRSRTGIVRIDYPTQEARLRCLKHYLWRKALEYQSADDSRDALIERLEMCVEDLGEVLGFEGIKHILNWKRVFDDDLVARLQLSTSA